MSKIFASRRIAILELSTNKLRAIEAAAAKLCDAVATMSGTEFRRLEIPVVVVREDVDVWRAARDRAAICESWHVASRPLVSAARRNQLESKLVRETRERNCGYLSILWNRRVMLLTDMPAVRFGDDPRTLI